MKQNQIKCILTVESFIEDSGLNGTNFTIFLSKEEFWKLIKDPLTRELKDFLEANNITPEQIQDIANEYKDYL